MFIIMLDNQRGYGRLFKTVEEAQIWQERYEIKGEIVAYGVDKSPEDVVE